MKIKISHLKKLICLFLTTISLTTSQEGPDDSPTIMKRSSYNFLSSDYPPYQEATNYDDFISMARITPALTLCVFYSKDHCLNCPDIEAVMTEIYERYRNHIK